ncbi:ABC-type spermidine/putrescine transport system, permease component II [Sphaerochaeta pleomorpha str. Grapes]|uniref:ABC-type spermidine/putrescine transport system, permease component II n=1 Tax=Sphaerochaeta pleomorpha (strain ATCC BAA-1885 / DSM 22778 / Grapes) TaxID=158190 RepID=G8QQS6_SPHPG|nr:ABC transporter permease [Sphaerochaeta pleomorpha]AEV28707.1 ABC-type spermidine/putrescine transport system, permease component II [Sphaerochaeta pleomorpha str. Grapes]
MYKHRFVAIVAWIVFAFIFLPLLLIVITSFNSADSITIPLEGFSLQWFGKVFQSRSLVSSFKNSLILALLASIIGIAFGLASSVALVKRPGKLSNLLLSIFLSPSLIPGIVIGYVLFRFLVVILAMPLNLALILGHLLVVMPYCVRIISASLKDVDESMEEAARSLGCTPVKAFLKVVLPNLKPAILSAFMLSFINSFNNIPVSMYLKGPGMNTLPYSMMNYIEYNYDPTVSALSVMLMAMTLLFMYIMDRTMSAQRMKTKLASGE